MKLDELEILSNSMVHVCREMGIVMQRASYSLVFSIALDFSCALFDNRGRMIAQAENIFGHLASLRGVLGTVLAGRGEINDGDVFASNDAYLGGMQSSDLCVLKPIFYNSELVGFAGNTAHHTDMGGMSPGSLASSATEIYQEGLQVPPVKIVKKGVLDREILSLITRNIRLPDDFSADLNAQVASVSTGERRLRRIIDNHGLRSYEEFTDEVIDYCERRMRAGIKTIPNGEYSFLDFLDNDGRRLDPLKISVKIRVRDGQMEFDFSGSADQASGPVNLPLHQTAGACAFAAKVVVDPYGPANEGMWKPITILAPVGSIMNPRRPSPVYAGTWITAERISETIWGALARAIPERIPAALGGCSNDIVLFGRRGNDVWVMIDWQVCGWGAMPRSDGQNALFLLYAGNPENNLVEVLEKRYPILVRRSSLRPSSGGPGKFRGGLGVITEYTAWPRGEISVTLLSDRMKHAPQGVMSGKSGKPARAVVVDEYGTERTLSSFESKCTGVVIGIGEVLRLESPGGGGYGDPFERDPSLVLNDVLVDYISPSEAESEYGVVIAKEERKVDFESTGKRRSMSTSFREPPIR